MDKQYIAIDLKSFYASVELSDMHLDPLDINLVVADPSRTEKTICLAVSPSLKSFGIAGRARLFEVIQRVKEVNTERFRRAKSLGLLKKDEMNGEYVFSGESNSLTELNADPSLKLAFITAPPRMALYEKISTHIFSIYLKYVSEEDIHVYSIDECFIDVTGYLRTYGLTAEELAIKMIRDVLSDTGITATAGIGTNMYLAKIAMDIVAKHMPADEHGVRMAKLDEMSYRKLLWSHTPITDFWRVGRGIAKKLSSLGCATMGDLARISLSHEDLLYKTFGVNAELLIDHAWGYEPTEISMIKSYKPTTNSISSGQVLMEPYDTEKAKLIVREMTELLVLDLVRKNVVTKQVTLTLGYDRESLKISYPNGSSSPVYTAASTGERYNGAVTTDPYGRTIPEHAHGTGNLEKYTSSTRKIMDVMMELYDRVINPSLLVRRVTVCANGLIRESDIPPEEPEQLDLFTDYEALEKKRAQEAISDEKERKMQKATLLLQEKFGKNAVLKGMNLTEGAMTIQRNRQIGGHKA